jgi:poly(hydroxyalkanoate) granule-associated protein
MATKKTTRKTPARKPRAKKKENPAEIVKDSANKIWLAGLGAFALAEEEGGKLFQNLVSKGKEFEDVGREQFDKARDKVESLADAAREKLDEATGEVRDRAGDTWERVEKQFDDRTARTLQKLGVPTRAEIARLTRRIEHLTELVEKKATTRRPATRKKTASGRATTPRLKAS